jgi:ribosomal protein S18 acetylase RimI-like enzyme
MRESGEGNIAIIRATERQRNDLELLVSRIGAEDDPGDARPAGRAPSARAEGLLRHDALSSDSIWFLIAYRGDRPAGLAVLTRVPKLDERAGFLHIDELHVLTEYRRQGVGGALMRSVVDLVRELGLAGVRLLTRPDNRAAQLFYESLGFHRSETLLYQLRVERHDPSF